MKCGGFGIHQGSFQRRNKAAEEKMVKAPGEWNRYTITCQNNMIWVLLNGKKINQMEMSLWETAEVNPDGSEIPEWLNIPLADLPPREHIDFQGKHAGALIYFRNIKIKEI